MRGIFCWLSCFLLLAGQMFAAEALDWAFIGVWDRSMPQVEAACRENGIHAEFFKGQKFNETQKAELAARFRLVFVLNLEAEQAPALTQRLKEARALNPEQRVIPLDTRGSQMDLEKAGLLLKDEAVPAYWRPNGTVNVRRLIRYSMVKYCGQPGEIETPVLLVHGQKDSAIPRSAVQRPADLIPQCTIEDVTNVGHLAHEEDPERLARIILEFAKAHVKR